MEESADAVARMQDAVPSSYIATVQPTQATTGVDEPLPTMHYNYTMFVNAALPDDLVYDLTSVLAENSEQMAARSRSSGSSTPSSCGGTSGCPTIRARSGTTRRTASSRPSSAAERPPLLNRAHGLPGSHGPYGDGRGQW
jgi:hypothetical protein